MVAGTAPPMGVARSTTTSPSLAGVVLAMFFVIYALNVVGDALRDALDPKLLE